MNFLDYIKSKIAFLALYALIFVMLTVSFALYGLPIAAVAYPMGLGLLLVIVYLALDYRKYKRKITKISELENKISRLTEMISSEKSKSRQRMDYYSVWAHQIKTPIASMRLSLQGEDSALSRKLGAELNRIESYADMVMTYLRLDSESTDYVFAECNLDSIIKSCVRKFSGEFIARKIELIYEPVHETVLTDEKWLSFVIEQVLSNSLKYTPSGSISICMEPGQILAISDTGIGIAGDDLPRIFDQGFTGYNGRTDKKASGIGLYLCKRICDDLGYEISAESELGKGTTIRLDLSKKQVVAN
ncbi:MAG: sensor histidine kinase [Oscillospiraceae bacterium]|nr:sensor histidine kinase [Oscillospiraceae bacterium]